MPIFYTFLSKACIFDDRALKTLARNGVCREILLKRVLTSFQSRTYDEMLEVFLCGNLGSEETEMVGFMGLVNSVIQSL